MKAISPSPHRVAGLLWASTVVLIVAGIVAAYIWLGPEQTADEYAETAPPPSAVHADGDYYLFVRLVEFRPRKPNGDRWDAGDGSAPDARVTIHWQDQKVFELPERNDQLIAAWDLFRVDVKDLVLNGGEVDVGALVNAPIVRVGVGDSITIEVWDDDPMFSDLALRLAIPLADLHEGPNLITPPQESGVARLRIDMINRSTPLPELVKLESERD